MIRWDICGWLVCGQRFGGHYSHVAHSDSHFPQVIRSSFQIHFLVVHALLLPERVPVALGDHFFGGDPIRQTLGVGGVGA